MIHRETLIAQSVFDFAVAELRSRGYSEGQVEFLEEFPYHVVEGQTKTLERNIVAVGFDFDDPGRPAEMGSDLMQRTYTIQFWVFAVEPATGENIAHALKFVLDGSGRIPLRDYADDAEPEVDSLEVTGTTSERQVIANDPTPAQQNVWTTTLKVEDTYYASLA